MQDVYELIYRYVNIRSKWMLLNDELKDLNHRKNFKSIELIRDGAEELSDALLKQIEEIINNSSLSDVNNLINVLNIEKTHFEKYNYEFSNSNKYRSDVCIELIDIISNYKYNLKWPKY